MELARVDTPLKQILEEEGRRQSWLAEKIDVDPRQVWNWVHGLHLPEHATREAIAEALGRDVQDVFPVSQPLEPAA